MSTTLVFGVIISGVVGSYVPHGIRQHTDVNQATAASVGDVMAYSGTEWAPTAPTALPTVATHTHATYLATTVAAATYAPIAAPDFTTGIEVSDGILPKVIFHDTAVGAVEDSNLGYAGGNFILRSRGRNVLKVENLGTYNLNTLGLKQSTITASAAISNPTCVNYVDATAGNIDLTLGAAADYYRNDTYYSGALLIIKRTDASANVVTIIPNGAETIGGAASMTLNGQNSVVFLQAIVGGWAKVYHYDSGYAVADSGWTNLTLNSPWNVVGTMYPTAGTPTYAVPGYRKIGSQVFLRGAADSGGAATNLMGTLPTGYRPAADYIFPSYWASSASSVTNATIIVKTDGSIGSWTPTIGNARTYHLQGISFPIG